MDRQHTSEDASETHGSSLESSSKNPRKGNQPKPAETKNLIISDDGSHGSNQLANDERRLSALRHESSEDGPDVMMLLETKNKQRLMMAHQEQEGMQQISE